METMYQYKVGNYQGMLQMLVYLIGRGYFFYCLVHLPTQKRDKWDKVDQKLIDKYQCEKSKWQRSRAKVKGDANFYYLRLDALAVILHTPGAFPDTILADDPFEDIRKKPCTLQITELTAFDVSVTKEKKVSVKLNSKTYQGLKDNIAQTAELKSKELLIREYNKVNGFPAWAGIIAQKRQLAKHVQNQAGRHQYKIESKDLRINTKRKIYKVFEINGKEGGLEDPRSSNE